MKVILKANIVISFFIELGQVFSELIRGADFNVRPLEHPA
jgi:hypothetical protein